MGRKKLFRYEDNSKDSLIIQSEKSEFDDYKNNRSEFFGNKNPLVLELACGKGEYTVGLAPNFLDKNFIGIDIKGNRLRYGAQKAKEIGLKNVCFIRSIIHHLDQFFLAHSVEEIWIIHPDPRPKNIDARRRLTYPRFLSMYKNILKPAGLLKLKTDDLDLFNYSLVTLIKDGWKILGQTTDLYNDPLIIEHYDIKTHYEEKFHKQGRNICYFKAVFVG